MQNFRIRLVVATVILVAAFLVITLRLWQLQILEGDEFEKFSHENRIRVERVPAPRGRILDRYGRELVVNRPSFDIYVLPKDINDHTTLSNSISQILGLDAAKIDADLEQALKKNRFSPVLIAKDINRDQLAYIEARRASLPGVIIEVNNLRKYPHGSLGASFLGYIGKVNDSELEADPTLNNNDLVGKTGVEKNWQTYLRGEDGFVQRVTDALGRDTGSKLFQEDLVRKESIPGSDIILSIDIDLQQASEEILGDNMGAIVVVDVRNGEVLTLVSKPTFNPVDFIKGIDRETWNKLINDEEFPLLNRATQGLYAPGSVFKMVPASAALQEGVISEDTLINCPGRYKLGSHTFRCWKRGGHGWMNLRLAIINSCDVYFYKLAESLGIDRLSEYMKAFGYGSYTGIGIEERKGVAPSREWKRERFNKPWYSGETIVSAIGQGYVSASPLQVAMMTAAIANNGNLYKPMMVREIVPSLGDEIIHTEPKTHDNLKINGEILEKIRDAMTAVVNQPGGTGRRAMIPDYTVAGKTGTAQVVSLDSRGSHRKHEDHAWFTAYAPAGAPEIAVTVLVEHGGKGGAVAAPLAKQVIEAYRRLKEKRDENDNV